ncbi:peptide methionine sulfoxide reductase [Thecamonas trahens ATCC 50062]|uniref:peptide-methionine (S)-S-oxide reductase n=1 Tax=Thecamonas trahens ATCC 50062 TaxID=461836 RepID=A0A0L0DCD2_THETB|nr:peptide methionine sulfoxide reductase [Thecamonas trahens ATCC 50062]KNC48968.1 peptide methionine sulfoxide reductase [Thecamonas trahens ATCC 50062]|eukprot:XP_013758385.1 peptide methionine sulfoxide reductase [Thecamonas trahens ATCC 50062]
MLHLHVATRHTIAMGATLAILHLHLHHLPTTSASTILTSLSDATTTTPPATGTGTGTASATGVTLSHLTPASTAMATDSIQNFCIGAGCYWGTEHYITHKFQKLFPDSISDAQVGFMGGDLPDPSYRDVCSGRTGHVEVVHGKLDTSKASFEDLVRFCFSFHDPTTLNRQHNDRGTEYASVWFAYSDEQAEVVENVKSELQALLDDGTVTCFEGKSVVTDVRPAAEFYPAHEDHQAYLAKNPGGYCSHRMYFTWP